MPNSERFLIANAAKIIFSILKIDESRVLTKAGLPTTLLQTEGRGVTAEQYFALWDAAMDETGDPETPLNLAQITARGQFAPAAFAFSCSPTVAVGLDRLALFKPLAGPLVMHIRRTEHEISFSFQSANPAHEFPDRIALFEQAFLLNYIRNLTTVHVKPLAFVLPRYAGNLDRLKDFVGGPVTLGGSAKVTLSSADGQLPLLSADEDIWAEFEPKLQRQLRERSGSLEDRVRAALLEMLPTGSATADHIAARLGFSKRSLHRRLQQEGVSFQAILDKTRTELALHYLARDDITVEEISYLLAFSDPNSFYRAFRNWTGMTPAAARAGRMGA